jgi:DNA-directed RNA polymerase
MSLKFNKEFKFSREEIKDAMMISGYSAGKKLITKTLQDSLKGRFVPEVVDAFYAVLADLFPAMDKIKSVFSQLWDNTRELYEWTMPDGFVVQYRPTDSYTIQINPFGILAISCIATISSATDRSTVLAVNYIHSWDAYIARMVKRLLSTNNMYTIHDGFRTLPSYVDEMNRLYTQQLADITDGNYFEQHLAEITGYKIVDLIKEFTGADVLQSKYTLC